MLPSCLPRCPWISKPFRLPSNVQMLFKFRESVVFVFFLSSLSSPIIFTRTKKIKKKLWKTNVQTKQKTLTTKLSQNGYENGYINDATSIRLRYKKRLQKGHKKLLQAVTENGCRKRLRNQRNLFSGAQQKRLQWSHKKNKTTTYKKRLQKPLQPNGYGQK